MKTPKILRPAILLPMALLLIGAFLAGALAFATNHTPSVIPHHAKIQGVVLNTADSQPIAGATVKITKSLTTITDREGSYFLKSVPSGEQTITIAASGFKTVKIKQVFTEQDSTYRINAWLSPGEDKKQEAVIETIDREHKEEAKSAQSSAQSSTESSTQDALQSNTVPSADLAFDLSTPAKPSIAAPSGSFARKAHFGTLNGGMLKMSTMPMNTRSQAYFRDKDDAAFNTEEYSHQNDNEFLFAHQNPLSTFSIDVDNASYSNMRRFLTQRQMPPKDAIRTEEMVNYFRYDYPQPRGAEPFSVSTEYSACPWNSAHKLVHIGLQGKQIPLQQLPASNLVFLIDVSGSMDSPEKLPLLKEAFTMLTKQLRPQDRVAIVVYAGAAGVVLPPTDGNDKQRIFSALQNLSAGGSTAGGEGIKLAYNLARQHFIKGGNNRVILATDGDFNVGTSSEGDLVRLIEKERESGVFLTVLGFGMGNYKDGKMEKLADKGNGNYAYIDNAREAERVLVGQMQGTLYTIAKDVKIQVEFNPAHVQAYRLIGYENRIMAKEDFNNDLKDAGEIGAGHAVTALYEIVPVGVPFQNPTGNGSVDMLKYQTHQKPHENKASSSTSKDLMTVKIRYKEPEGAFSKLIERPVPSFDAPLQAASANFKFSAAVAEFAMILRESPFKAQASYNQVLSLAGESLGKDPEGYRAEFIRLVETAQILTSGVVRNQRER